MIVIKKKGDKTMFEEIIAMLKSFIDSILELFYGVMPL